MRIVFVLCCCVMMSSTSVAQIEPCLNVTSSVRNGLQAESKQSLFQSSETSRGVGSMRKLSPYRPAIGVSQYLFDGQSRTAPTMGMQYVPTGNADHKLTFSGGIVWLPKSSSVITTSNGFTGFGRYDYANGLYGQPSPALALAYAGAEYRYYLLRGDVQPYVGAGAYGLGWKYGSAWGSTLAPSLMGGLSAEISTVFNGYVELRQLVGIGTFIGRSSFGGSTTVAAGFAFAPNFSSW